MNKQISPAELEQRVTQIMTYAGIPTHLKGYHYLREAILISGQDMITLTSVTKLLYPPIAKRYNTTEQKVERSIRNAIEISWLRGNINAFEHLFGYSSVSGRQRPTNSEYIYGFADKIRSDIREPFL